MLRLLLPVLLIAPSFAQQITNDRGVSMGHVHLNVADPKAHQQLWIDHFGGVAIERNGIPGIRIPQLLLLFRQQEPTGGFEGAVMEHFGLKVRNTAEVVERWRTAGLTVQAEFTGAEGFPNAYLLFPDNMRLEIQQDESLEVIGEGHHLHYFLVSDHLPLRQWYVDTFGAPPSKRSRIDSADLPERMNLSFMTSRRATELTGSKGRVIDHVAFEVRGLEAFCKQLAANGVEFDSPYGINPELAVPSATLTDPSGVVVELTEGLAP